LTSKATSNWKLSSGKPGSKVIKICYLVVDGDTSYNALLGRPSLNALGTIVSTPDLTMKFPAKDGSIVTIYENQKTTRECYIASLKIQPERVIPKHCGNRTVAMADLDPRIHDENRMEPKEPTETYQISGAYQLDKIGEQLPKTDKERLKETLMSYKSVLAWMTTDMPGVDPQIASHRLSVYRDARPITQRKRNVGEERRVAAEIEVDKLLKVGFIREVHYTTWLANVVLVKPSRKWRMCVDYTDLNKAYPKDAYPKDAYPLPGIDRLDGA